jgi:hypothetical protein
MKKVALLIVVLLIFFQAVNGSGEEYSLKLITNTVDLSAWTLDKYYNDQADIYQDVYLRANPVDGRAFLKKAIIPPANLKAIVMEYDGALQYSYWGQNTGVFIVTDSGEYSFQTGMNNCCENKNSHQFLLRHGQGISSHILNNISYGVYHYTVVFSSGEISAEAMNANGEIVYNATASFPNLDITKVTELKYWVYTTSDNNSWMKNLTFSFLRDDQEEVSVNNYSNLTLATGTAIGYGEGVVENQTDDFNVNDTIHFGVFADVTVPHTWRIEAYHNNDFWWGQNSDSRGALNHSFHSLNQEVTVSGTFTFKVLLDTGNGFEEVGEKSVIID